MKLSRLSGFQITRFFRFQKKSTRVCSSVTLGSIPRRELLTGCCPAGSCIFSQRISKLKNRCKQYLGWQLQRTTPQYSYDFHSYCLNFDDGSSSDHIPPRTVS
ncbi:hypothetical protein L6164_034362 [Bauhinia variegata]|uniref:Uncharacterized protein n=1 Tax=Bauhinia variegata TaxID=167791 RepID=A0ACB9KVE0_BAUVA|nr:hypothetical protein L6164_034362 [Bauhinia variegata]